MSKENDSEVPITLEAAEEHLHNLDAAYRSMGKTFKLLTYEQGRVEADFEESYGDDLKKELATVVAELHAVGERVQSLAVKVKHKAETAYGGQEEEKANHADLTG